MNRETLFCHLSSGQIADLIRSAEGYVCYAGPGIQKGPALAMFEVAKRLGPELMTVTMDFDERVMRMGYGDVESVQWLRDAGIVINHSPGLRSALIIVDGEGFTFTPTALYLEAESRSAKSRNAMRLSPDQVAEALARLSPAAKAIAIAGAEDQEEKARIAELPVEVGHSRVDEEQFKQIESNLKQAPPVPFDLARQVHVFEPYLQYVELSLTGASIQSHRLVIPSSIQKLGASQDLEGRLRTTFNLIAKNDKLSSKQLTNRLAEIRNALTHSLGEKHGRVISKRNIPRLETRLAELAVQLEAYQKKLGEDLQKHLDESRNTIIDYYLPLVMNEPPDVLFGRSLSGTVTEAGCRAWLDSELDRVFPNAESLIQDMKLEKRYKDVTYDTLNREDFWESVKVAFPDEDWGKAYSDFLAAGERDQGATKSAGKGN